MNLVRGLCSSTCEAAAVRGFTSNSAVLVRQICVMLPLRYGGHDSWEEIVGRGLGVRLVLALSGEVNMGQGTSMT